MDSGLLRQNDNCDLARLRKGRYVGFDCKSFVLNPSNRELPTTVILDRAIARSDPESRDAF
jgi:hypothetical protein